MNFATPKRATSEGSSERDAQRTVTPLALGVLLVKETTVTAIHTSNLTQLTTKTASKRRSRCRLVRKMDWRHHQNMPHRCVMQSY
uniref:Uncharacterized protein n=1 Tax=Steinernema glaseri TaxID=37863 RepID=A0A1I7ZP80_9BILA